MNKPTRILEQLREQKLKESKARTALMVQEKAIKDRDLIVRAEVDVELRRALMPCRQRFLALPNECAHLCNPADPTFARDALTRWVDDALRIVKSDILGEPKPKPSAKRRKR